MAGRIMELMKTVTQETSDGAEGQGQGERDIKIRFLLQPQDLLSEEQPLQVECSASGYRH